MDETQESYIVLLRDEARKHVAEVARLTALVRNVHEISCSYENVSTQTLLSRIRELTK